MYNEFEGKTVVVTGGAKGIGLAIASHFRTLGCSQVVVIDNDREALADLDDFYEKVLLDVSNKEAVDQELRFRWLEVDVLVNNAAITEGDDHERIMAVNVNGSRYVTEVLLLCMNFGASVIFITSVHTALAFRNDAAYDCSKHAVCGYMRARAVEWAPFGIRFNAVAPGATLSGPNLGHSQEVLNQIAQKIPARRWGQPEEIARMVAFLASDDASYVIGQEIRVDGGMSIDSQFR